MLCPYPKPSPFTWLPITTRPLLPVFPPSDPLITRPILPSPPRQSAFDAPYTLTTHVFPAAYLRTTAHVPVPSPPPENATKAERLKFFTKTRQELTDLRTTIEPQGVPQVLWNCVNRYVRADLDGNKRTSTKGVTLFCAHANGFPKEVSTLSFDSAIYLHRTRRHGSLHFGTSSHLLLAPSSTKCGASSPCNMAMRT